MEKELVDILACPFCKGDLELTVFEEDTEVKEGILRCICGKEYMIQNYIPRFVQENSQ